MLIESLHNWFDTPTYREERRFLEAHTKLLDMRCDALLDDLIQQNGGQPKQVRMLRRHQCLLRDIRARTAALDTVAAIHEGYVNARGGLALDVPAWLEENERHLKTSRRSGVSEQTTGTQAAHLRDMIVCAQQDSKVAPETLAELNRMLGNTLRDDAHSPRAPALEGALAAYMVALDVYTFPRYPLAYGITQNDLAYMCQYSDVGEQKDNLEQAIAHYQEALRVVTAEDIPDVYFGIQYNLANAYIERSVGSRRDNLEQALTHLREALRFYTHEEFPKEHAMAQHQLAYVYADRIVGSHRDNVEQAIAHYQEALHVYTYNDFREGYARTQLNLANAYWERVAGSQRDNLEQARTHLREALRVYTYEKFPEQYAATQHDLGNVYSDRIAGSQRDNLEAAIKHFQEALRVYTYEEFPEQYAHTQQNLAITYSDRIAGNQHDNQEQAITHCQEALRVFTYEAFPIDYAGAQANLAIFLKRLAGSQRDNLEAAIKHFQEALRVYTYEEFPEQYAKVQHNLGFVYSDRIEGNRHDNVEQAIDHFREALRVLTREEFPTTHRDTQINLASMGFYRLAGEAEANGDADGARDAYRHAHEAYVAAREAQAELGWQESDELGRVLLRRGLRDLFDPYTMDAWCLWQLGDPLSAATALEAGRAQALAEAGAISGANLVGVCPAHAEQFTRARQALREARSRGDRRSIPLAHGVILPDRDAIHLARATFLEARQTIRGHCKPDFLPGEPLATDVMEAPAPNQTLVYLMAADRGGFAIVVLPEREESHRDEKPAQVAHSVPVVVPLSHLTSQVVDTWLERRDTDEWVVGGLRPALEHRGASLLWDWLARSGENTSEIEHVEQRLGPQLSEVGRALPTAYNTLGEALQRLTDVWRWRADQFATGTIEQQEQANELRARLTLPLGKALTNLVSGELEAQFSWLFLKAELSLLLPDLSATVMVPLRAALSDLGLDDPNQPIALVACGRLGALPLHAALVPDPQHVGQTAPFQETCEFTYQASARTLAVARSAAAHLPINGPFLTIGDPQPTSEIPLHTARQEAEAIATLGQQRGRNGSWALLGETATLGRVLELLRAIPSQYAGAWVVLASHGVANPTDPNRCFMLLADDEKLTLADLQRERLLEDARCFTASGCVTALGDLEIAPDELSSFAAGVLQAGAASAIATQWSVSGWATSLLMVRFALLVMDHSEWSPARALRQAAKWLRTMTSVELKEIERAEQQQLVLGEILGSLGNYDGQKRPGRPQQSRHDWDSRGSFQRVMVAPDVAQKGSAILGEEAIADASNDKLQQEKRTSGGWQGSITVDYSQDSPYTHPIYWASAVIYGA